MMTVNTSSNWRYFLRLSDSFIRLTFLQHLIEGIALELSSLCVRLEKVDIYNPGDENAKRDQRYDSEYHYVPFFFFGFFLRERLYAVINLFICKITLVTFFGALEKRSSPIA